VTLNNSTVSGNTANGKPPPDVPFGGGGIYGTLALNNATITDNDTQTGDGGGINNTASAVNFKNTIIVGNTDAGGQAPDCSGTLTLQDYNLIQDTTGCTIGGTTTNNITGQDPRLSALADNGGPTQTHAAGFALATAVDSGSIL